MITPFLQILIFFFTGAGLWLTASNDAGQQRRGFLLCMLGQPLWIIDTYQHQQWGMLLLSIWLALSFTWGWWQRR